MTEPLHTQAADMATDTTSSASSSSRDRDSIHIAPHVIEVADITEAPVTGRESSQSAVSSTPTSNWQDAVQDPPQTAGQVNPSTAEDAKSLESASSTESNSSKVAPRTPDSAERHTYTIPEVHFERATPSSSPFDSPFDSPSSSRPGSMRPAISSGVQFSDPFQNSSVQSSRQHSRQGSRQQSRQHSRQVSRQGSVQGIHEPFNPFDPLQRVRLGQRSHSHVGISNQTSPNRPSLQWSGRNNSYAGPSTMGKSSGLRNMSEAPTLYYEQPKFGSRMDSFSAMIDKGEKSFDEKDPAFMKGKSVDPKLKWGPQPYFRSRRIKKGTIERPELKEKDPKEIWVTIIPLIGFAVGCGIIGLLTWVGLHSVVNHHYCSVLYDDFSHGFNPRVWSQEVQCGGYGVGEFEQTTGDNSNVFVRDGKLILKPTLQNASLIAQDTVTNLTSDGTCTSTEVSECQFASNITAGLIAPPVFSARINTKNSVNIRYGKVEVTARMAGGDWLLPAIWMLPVNNTYGAWPLSGEIDIARSRGNDYTYPLGGNNVISSTLHWGPDSINDGWWRTNANATALHTTYVAKTHTFGVEWNEKYLFTYVNSRLMQAMYSKFNEPQFKRGDFPATDAEGNELANPWVNGTNAAPFDQSFYLIISLAVGSTAGWFTDGSANKPWVDTSITARKMFWDARDQWYPTWQAHNDGEMVVEKVRIWKQCDKQ